MRLIDFRMGICVLMAVLSTGVVSAKPDSLTDTKKTKKEASGQSAKIPSGVLSGLSSEQYDERVKAYVALEKWALENTKTSPEVLHGVWSSSDDPEAQTRCFALMKKVAVQRQFGKGKGFVGIRMEEFQAPGLPGEPGRPSVRVSFVLPDTPAAKSGLKVGDVVLGVDGRDFSEEAKQAKAGKKERVFGRRARVVIGMETVSRFSQYIQSKQPGDEITLHLLREGKKSDMKIKLMKRPLPADADPFGGVRPDNRKREADQFFNEWLEQRGKKGS